jgi:aspartate-semialdehyde dehydrogenase
VISGRTYRIGIVGASSLLGKELADTLAESALAACDVVLLDDEDAGQVVAAGDEATFIQKLDADSFAGIDFVFFAGDASTTSKYWKTARTAGASIVDMTYALESEAGVVVLGPWASPLAEVRPSTRTNELGLTTPAVVAAHPAALTLLLIANRLQAKFPVRSIAATFFEPASEHGRAAMDELHQQTVSLLSFQSLPREQYDAQVAFNLLPSLGEASKVNLAVTKMRIANHYAALAGSATAGLALQLVQAPVFHGYVASVLIELERTATIEQLELAAYGEHVDVVAAESDPPSNISAAGQAEILMQVTSAGVGDGATAKFWMWLAADNLKLMALNAIACATELRRLRPQGKVQ